MADMAPGSTQVVLRVTRNSRLQVAQKLFRVVRNSFIDALSTSIIGSVYQGVAVLGVQYVGTP